MCATAYFFLLSLTSAIDILAPLDEVIVAYTDGGRLDLSQFFLGQDLTFAVTGDVAVAQRVAAVTQASQRGLVYPGLIEQEPARGLLYVLTEDTLKIWEVTEPLQLKARGSAVLGMRGTLLGVYSFVAGFEYFAVVAAQSGRQVTVNVYNTTDPAHPPLNNAVSWELERNQKLVSGTVLMQPTSNFWVLSTGSGQSRLHSVKLQPQLEYIATFTDEQLGFPQMQAISVHGTGESLIVCDQKYGLISLNAAQSDVLPRVAVNQQAPLLYGRLLSCGLTGTRFFAGTSTGIAEFHAVTLDYVQKYYRSPAPAQDYELLDLSRVSAVGPLVASYFTSTTGSRSEVSLRILDTSQSLLYSTVIDSQLSVLLGTSETPPYFFGFTGSTWYLVFSQRQRLSLFELHVPPKLVIPQQKQPTDLIGTITVSNADATITKRYNISCISPDSFHIRTWRGMHPSDAFKHPTELCLENSPFYLPLNNYLSGQAVSYQVTVPEKKVHATVPAVPIKLSETKLPKRESPIFVSYEYSESLYLLIGSRTESFVTIYLEAKPGHLSKVLTVSCREETMTVSHAAFSGFSDQVYLALECWSQPTVTWEFFTYQNELIFLGSHQSTLQKPSEELLFVCDHLYAMTSSMVEIFEVNLSLNFTLSPRYPFNDVSFSEIDQFKPLAIASDKDCGSILVYNYYTGLMLVHTGDWVPFYNYTAISIPEVLGESQVQLQYSAHQAYAFFPNVTDHLGLFQIDLEANSVSKEFPTLALDTYSGIYVAGDFLYLVSDSALYMWDTEDYTFEGLYTILNKPSIEGVAASWLEPTILHVVQNDVITSYLMGQNISDVHSTFVPATEMDDTVWSIVDFAVTKGQVTTKLNIHAENQQDSTSLSILLHLSANGATVVPNRQFSSSKSPLTSSSSIRVKSKRQVDIPLDAFLGNGLEFLLESSDHSYLPHSDCDFSKPICVQSKALDLKPSASGFEVALFNEHLLISSLNNITVYNFSNNTLEAISSIPLDQLLGKNSVRCLTLETLPMTQVAMSCQSQSSANISATETFLTILDLNARSSSNLSPQYAPSSLLMWHYSRLFSYEGGQLVLYNYENNKLEEGMSISGEQLQLASFEVIGMFSLNTTTMVLVLPKSVVMLSVSAASEIAVLSNIKLSCTTNSLHTPHIVSATRVDSLVIAIDSAGYMYTVSLNNSELEQIAVHPPYIDVTVPTVRSLAVHSSENSVTFPVKYKNSVYYRCVHYSKLPTSYIYTDIPVPEAPARLLSLSNSTVLGVSSQSELTLFEINYRPVVQFKHFSSADNQRVKLVARNQLSSSKRGHLHLKFHSSSSSNSNIVSKWWFWVALVGGVLLVAGIVVLIVILVKRRKNETHKRLTMLSIGFAINKEDSFA